MLNTGIREGKRRRLRFEEIDFINKRILLRSSKANEYRSIPMNEEVEKTLVWLQKNYIPPYSTSQKSYPRQENQVEKLPLVSENTTTN
jgi:hypothetical protein